ncbi:MAG: metallophosphoesterase [Candidatus Moranbacteria bacterium]|nr:metallophosphoesterase [Candidatus Moranbacteria bacterium]
MKRYLIITLAILFMALGAVSSGILFAEWQIGRNRTVEISNPSNNLPEEPEAKESDMVTSEAEKETKNDPADSELQTSPDSFSFAVIGDTRSFKENDPDGGLQKAVKGIKEKNVDLVLTVGDLISGCDTRSDCEDEFGSWKKVMGPLLSKTYEVVGNHDRVAFPEMENVWQNYFDLPLNGPAGFSEKVYSFDFKNSHFVVLDSEEPVERIINSTQRDWLEKDLESSKGKNIFVSFHEPAFPVAANIGESLDAYEKERDALWDILVKYDVTAVFCGHEHIYSRKKIGNIYQIMVANTDVESYEAPRAGVVEYYYQGKHYAIVQINGEKITLKVYSVDGKLLDFINLSG